MKAVLICPDERSEVSLLSMEAPLAVTPALGQSVVEYWMSHLACAGVKEVALLANDRPDAVRNVIGNGSRWGVAAEVMAESRELTPEHAADKYGGRASVMDHFPGFPAYPLFGSYEQWFGALEAWMPRAETPDRVGMRELHPGIWVGLHGHLSPEARLCAPCWLADNVYVGPGAVIGPGTILEKGAFIEPKAEIKRSVIGAATFVGQYVQITNSLAWGNTLVNWQTGLENKVSDAFLLCSLHARRPAAKAAPLLDRVADWLARWKEDEDQPLESQPILIKKGS
jgi:NDP-sugar pyrophosphorylase family protein